MTTRGYPDQPGGSKSAATAKTERLSTQGAYMRNDQLEAVAGEIAAAVAQAVLAAAGKLDPAVADLLSAVASQAARDAAWRAMSRATAVRIEADTANVVDLRTR